MSNKPTILIVDDEDSIRESFSALLKIKGFNVFTARDGLEAFDIVKKESIGYILTDVRMPKCDGVSLLKLVKEFNPNIPVVLVTGYSDFKKQDLIDQGASQILAKPFRIKDLFDSITQFASI